MRKRPLAAVATLTCLAAAPAAAAEDLCRAMDATDPLNMRVAPNSRIIQTLNNGLLVAVVDTRDHANGRSRAFIVRAKDGRPFGRVLREFIACF